MSYSAKDSVRSLKRNSGSGQQAEPSPVLKSSRDGDTAYVEDSRAIGEAVKKIQQHAADVRRETSMIGTAHSLNTGKKKVKEAVRSAKALVSEANVLLKEFPTSAHSNVSEQTHRRLTQQKLTENLMGASKAVEAAYRAYENAEAAWESQMALSTATTALNSIRSATSATSSLEMHAMEGQQGTSEAPDNLSKQELQDLEAPQVEVDLHSVMVDEYADEVSSISSSISSLQRAMVDLAEHAQAQGLSLDVIEGNMTNSTNMTAGARQELMYSSRHQRRGNKLTCGFTIVAVLVAMLLVLVVVRKSG